MLTVNTTVIADLSLDIKLVSLHITYRIYLNNTITEKLSLLAELRIPVQGMNVEQHCPTGIGYICTVNASILSTCQTLNKKYQQFSPRKRYRFTVTNYKITILHSQSFQCGTGNSNISATTKEADLR